LDSRFEKKAFPQGAVEVFSHIDENHTGSLLLAQVSVGPLDKAAQLHRRANCGVGPKPLVTHQTVRI
jgi:hypothetical protein